ncbi:cadherin-related family member 5 isoform X6 [Pleurodeles waltl]|uniref:cadherin-related family member 5 isoform X6 n=1 Tax=Pleurodeles waltl TaxID=8319 RepID=UPI003709720F
MAASLGSALVPLCLLLSTYLGIALAQGNQVCSASSGRIEENKPAGSVVTTIVAAADVTVTIDQGPGSDPYSHFFKINGSNLVLNNSLDYEEVNVIVLTLLCQKNGITVNELTVTVEVLNLNDERPVFERDFVAWQVPEDTKVGTSLGSLTARDADLDLIYYDLVATSSDGSSQFRLAGVNSPTIELSGALDYDVFTHAQFLLYARDTLETNVTPSHTATATINITILDVDNKNPWFQPCRFIDANKKICHSDGYHVNVTRSENVTGALVLRPGPLYAIDGDRGINDAIRYEVISGNEENIFVLGNETGNITMQKPASVPGTIVLEVLASEVNNSLRYAVTSVQIQVVERNKHPPRFQSTAYRGTMPAYSLPGSLVMEFNSPSRPLKIVAEDEDFDDKKNPAISYSIENSTDFLVSQDGYIQSSAQLNTSGTTVILAAAVDKTSGEKATTVVVVEISPVAGIPVVISPLQYSAADMAAVGASLAAVLLICLAVLGFLIHKQYGYKFAKIPAMDINFPSTASGDSNEGNKKLIDNECAESTNSAPNEADIEGGTLNLNFRASETTTDSLPRESSALRVTEAAFPSAFFAVDQLEEDVDKEVRSILTKERRVNDESYKAVWFKGDIEPDEVVTIHENEQDVEGEEDELSDEVGEEEEEEDESDDGEDQQGGGYNHEPTVAFSTNNESINTIL